MIFHFPPYIGTDEFTTSLDAIATGNIICSNKVAGKLFSDIEIPDPDTLVAGVEIFYLIIFI